MNAITSVEQAHEAMAIAAQKFPGARAWDKVSAMFETWPQMVSMRWSLWKDGVQDRTGASPTKEIRDLALESAGFLRDHLLHTTGRRIWGLTFTLYPDGKFDTEYDYNKPPHYEEDDEITESSETTPVANLLNGLVNVSGPGITDQSPEAQRLSSALAWLQQQTAKYSATWGLGSEANWNLDMNEGWLRWTFADGRVMQADVQVIGTYNTKNSSFMWGWDHPSVPEPLRRAAHAVQTLGQQLGVERWTTRTVTCTEDEAWQFTALAAQQDGAAGAYRGNANGTWVYMSFGEPASNDQLAKNPQP